MVVIEKIIFFMTFFFQTAFNSKWFQQQKFNWFKMKDNFMMLLVTCQSVSDLVRPSTCPFVGSSDHCLSSHSMDSFGTGKTLLPQWVINPLCHCSCSLALIWDWEWVWGWCVYALFKLLEMEQCVDILIPCDDLEINFWQNVFQINNFLFSFFMMILAIYIWFPTP